MKTINYGKLNDCTVYAVEVDGWLYPLNEIDMEFEAPDYRINYDSGVYPSIPDIPQYICNQVVVNKMLLVGVKEAATILGWDHRRVATYRSRGSFPEPIAELAMGPVWTRAQIEEFAKKRGKAPED